MRVGDPVWFDPKDPAKIFDKDRPLPLAGEISRIEKDLITIEYLTPHRHRLHLVATREEVRPRMIKSAGGLG